MGCILNVFLLIICCILHDEMAYFVRCFDALYTMN